MSGTADDGYISALVDIAHLGRWLAFHPLPARTKKGWRTLFMGDAGWFDVVFMRPPEILFVEVKGRVSSLSPEQRAWRDAALGCPGAEWHLWRPADRDTARIRLTSRTARQTARSRALSAIAAYDGPDVWDVILAALTPPRDDASLART